MTEASHGWLAITESYEQWLKPCDCATEQVHVYDTQSIDAINAAIAARRPLLVRGEPGTGKSQLAMAAAATLGRPLCKRVVDSHTTAQDLLWSFDAVARLAQAQLLGALGKQDPEEAERKLDERRYVKPGPLWWGLNWQSALDHVSKFGGRGQPPAAPVGWFQEKGTVVLIDEIDKADSDVPNGLLEVLGSGWFTPDGYDDALCMAGKNPPLVVITTNEERSLPDAFVRRCLVLQLGLPDTPSALKELLVRRGKAHFPTANEAVLETAAQLLINDRKEYRERRLPPPGQAEYLDLLRAVLGLRERPQQQLELLETVATYVLKKHPRDAVR